MRRVRLRRAFMDSGPRVAESYVPEGLKRRTFEVPGSEGPFEIGGYEFGAFWIVKGADALGWTVLTERGELIGNSGSLPVAIARAGWICSSKVAGRA